MNHFIYIIYSAAIDRYYVGMTSQNPKERLAKHNTNHKGFTGKSNDWVIKYQESFPCKRKALMREKEIKKRKSKKKIMALINS